MRKLTSALRKVLPWPVRNVLSRCRELAGFSLHPDLQPQLLSQLHEHARQTGLPNLLRLLEIFEDMSGHRASAQAGKPVNIAGQPLPWYTYPAISFLDQVDLGGKTVFEFGAGNSSLYFARRARRVISVESDPRWYAQVAASKPANLTIHLCPQEAEYLRVLCEGEVLPDVIAIDGAWRRPCARAAITRLAPEGFIILDNSDWFPKTASDLRSAGLVQIDFAGFGPVNYYTWTTSVFFRRDVRLTPQAAGQPLPSWGALTHEVDEDAGISEAALEPLSGETVPDSYCSVAADIAQEPEHGRLSFAQEGEDRLLARFLEPRAQGFYVDVGACHPRRFSNTHYFYLQGWRGINVEPRPGSGKLFSKLRPGDINLELAVAAQPGTLTYHMFGEEALNTFDPLLARQYQDQGHPVLREIQMQTNTLSELLDKYLPEGQTIDFLNVDVEGLDLEVLRSNDWTRYRPHLVLTEELHVRTLGEAEKTPTASFLFQQGYELIAKTMNSLLFGQRE
jgi:FkbM family methyltransferase